MIFLFVLIVITMASQFMIFAQHENKSESDEDDT